MRTLTYCLFHVALHEAKFLQACCHQAANVHVHVHPLHAGCCYRESQVMAFLHDAVYLALALGKASANGSGTGVVGAVVLVGLSTTVA